MDSVSTPTRKKTWQPSRRRVSVLAEMALRKERIAERLSDLRGRKGFSQEQAAAFVGITVRQWQRWEAGESVPYPRNLDQIASRFGISVAEFFDDASTNGNVPQQSASQLAEIELVQRAILDRLEALAVEVAELRKDMRARQAS